MHAKKLIFFILTSLYCSLMQAQTKPTEAVAEANSLRLYYAQDWTGLLTYGKSTLRSGIDFPMLRMRTGYAALVLGNYSESLKQYSKTYAKDKHNSTALYYSYLANVYLNNITSARYYASKLSRDTRNAEKLKRIKVSAISLTYSLKYPNLDARGNGNYGSAGLAIQLGYRLELQQVVGFFNQTINEPAFKYVTDNTKIAISQKEYYARLIFAATSRLSLLGGYHYIHTPFNNYSYNNKLSFGGIKYTLPYLHFQGMFHSGKITDTTFKQFDIAITTYPLGNTKLYTISKAAYVKELTFTQIAGIKVMKHIWMEANTTLGKYKVLLDNEGQYLFNDIDTKKFKAGGTVYFLVAKKLLFSVNYIFEKKQRFGTTDAYFNQHSTTTGLLWNF